MKQNQATSKFAFVWYFVFIGLIGLGLVINGCTNGSMSMRSMGLEPEGLVITSPPQGVKGMRTLSKTLVISGEFNSDYTGLEISFDNVTFKNIETLDNPSSSAALSSISPFISFQKNCDTYCSFQMTISDLPTFLAQNSPSFDPNNPLGADSSFALRAFNFRSNSAPETVTITKLPDVIGHLHLLNPLSSPGASNTPTLGVDEGLEVGDVVTLYFDSICQNPAAGLQVYTGIPIQFTITPLTELVDYTFYAQINSGPCSSGLMNYRFESAAKIPILEATITSTNKIDLSWATLTGAAKYILYRKLTTDAGWTLLTQTTSGILYPDTSVTAGSTYSYQLVVEFSDGVTRSSSVIDKTALGGFTVAPLASVSKKVVTISWPKVLGATAYKVMWGPESQNYQMAEVIAADSNATAQFTFTGDSNTRNFYYILVKAKNGSDYVDSSEITIVTDFSQELDTNFNSTGYATIKGESVSALQAIKALDFDIDGHTYFVGHRQAMLNGTLGTQGIYGKFSYPGSYANDFLKLIDNANFFTLGILKGTSEGILGGAQINDLLLYRMNSDGTRNLNFEANRTSSSGSGNISETLNLIFSGSGKFAKVVLDHKNQKLLGCTSGLTLDGDDAYVNSFRILRFNFDGTLDQTWATSGVFTFSASDQITTFITLDCQLDASGNLLVLTHKSTSNAKLLQLFRLNSQGILDTSFGTSSGPNAGLITWNSTDAGVEEHPKKLLLLSDQSFLVLGALIKQATSNGSTITSYSPFLLRYDSTGTLINSFGNNGLWSLNNWTESAAFLSGVLDTRVNINILYFTGWKLISGNQRDMAIWKFDLTHSSFDGTFGNGGVLTFHNTSGGNGNDEGVDIGINPKSLNLFVGGRSQTAQGIYEPVIWSLK